MYILANEIICNYVHQPILCLLRFYELKYFFGNEKFLPVVQNCLSTWYVYGYNSENLSLPCKTKTAGVF